MEERAKNVRKSILTVLGTIIGAGIFGLPTLFSTVGFWPGTLLFWLLALLVLATHLLYVEVILHTKERMRLAGHAKHWLGRPGFLIASITYPLQIIGVNFVYLLLGGGFLFTLAQRYGFGGSALHWQLLFWLGGSFTVLFGLKFVAKVEAVATWLLIVMLLAVVAVTSWSASEVQVLPAHWNLFFLPFGIFLFTVSGMSIIGEAADLVKRNRRDTYLAVTLGTLGAAFLSWLFGVTLSMMQLPMVWEWLLMVVGVLAIFTSYITTAQDLKATFHLDFDIPKRLAWFLALFIPMSLLFFIQRDFLQVLDFIGTLFTGTNGVLIALIAWMVWKKYPKIKWMMVTAPLVAFAFLFGMLNKFFFS